MISGEQLKLVFPLNEDITNLTRLFEEYEVKNNFETNPFFISNINYLTPSEEDGYRVLPFSFTVTSSKKNLTEFLEYIESSGSLESEVRLMSIERMSISYPEEFGGEYEVNFSINAYYSRDI